MLVLKPDSAQRPDDDPQARVSVAEDSRDDEYDRRPQEQVEG